MIGTVVTKNIPLILIVDDDLFMRVTSQNALEEAGFATATASDGTAAIACFNNLQPDLVLLDLVMPGKDGFRACREIRSMPGGKYTPILMVTSLEDTESIHHSYEAGATDFISKPVNPELLVYRVRYILRANGNLTELKRSEERLRMLKEAIDCLPVGITLSDVHGKIMYSNPADAELHGYLGEELVGREASLFAPPRLKKPFPQGEINSIGVWRRESVNARKNGEEFPVQLSSIAVTDAAGRSLGLVTACEDITSRKEAEEKIYRLAYYDSLTGLPNRRTFLDRLQQALSLAYREQYQVGLLFLDLDNFKDINDTQGHDFGDKLLRAVAERLPVGMRGSDTLARLGGDEFVVVLTSVSSQESAAVAAQRILSTFSRPFVLEGRTINISASIGIALYPNDAQNAESLFKCADTAMYHAKDEGKSNYRFFSVEMNEKLIRRVALENCMRRGLEEREFFVEYQPKWNVRTARMTGIEALARWQSAEFGLLQPSEFIPLAEKTGFIFCLGEWILRTSCAQAREWILAGHRDIKVAVNISGQQFRHPDFLETMERIIRDTGIEPGSLELEFTETVIMEKADRTIETLRSLKKLGILLSIDDFGTGYSSLSYLKHFPIDRVKIDRSFVADVNLCTDDAAITEAIISMAHSLKLTVVAEGVENGEQLHFLAKRHCDEVQGFYLARPMTAEKFAESMEQNLRKDGAGYPVHERCIDLSNS